ncbi:MAG: hypothetical protein C0483_15275 [Pirellula sp.]|nr:hypothetical protein [Pirellula sp.]
MVSGDAERATGAVAYFDALERGHLEEHPLSKKLVLENIDALLMLWHEGRVPGGRTWVLQFVADAHIASLATKPLVVSALSEPSCAFLPTVLYLMGTEPDLFSDTGQYMQALSRHPDREVRWRVAWFISKLRYRDDEMYAAIQVLEQDPDPTTQVYVRECRVKA